MSSRRTKGDGSLYQRADGRWCGSVDLGWTPDGKRKRKVVTAKTQAEALAKLRAVRRLKETGASVPTKSLTVADWLNRWLEEIVARKVKPKTLDGYRHKVTIINEAIGRTRLDKLTVADVRKMHDHAIDGRSQTTARHCHFVLTGALDAAIREGVATVNVAKIEEPPAKVTYKSQALTNPEARRFLRAVESDPLAARWLLALLYGMRQGEALGLTWECVDYSTQTIDLAWQLQRLTWRHGCKPACGRRPAACPARHLGIPPAFDSRPLEGAWVLTRPKREKERIVPMFPVVEAVLRQRQSESANDPSPYGLVFARPDGRPFDPARDNHAWHAWLDTAGLPSVRLHDARHTAATLLQAEGVDEATRMSILGHSTATVARSYAHIDQATQRAGLERLARSLTD